MTVKKKVGFKQMVAEAESQIDILTPTQAMDLVGQEDVVFVDIRDVRELERDGKLPGAYHMPRGMLEFWVDPDSPYYKPVFDEDKRFVFYCAAAWRSALATATAKKIGLEKAFHIDGGLSAWKEAGGPVEEYNRKT